MKKLINELFYNENIKALIVFLSTGEEINLKQKGITCVLGYDDYFILANSNKKTFISYSNIAKITIPQEVVD